jgi:hypothetical protein
MALLFAIVNIGVVHMQGADTPSSEGKLQGVYIIVACRVISKQIPLRP